VAAYWVSAVAVFLVVAWFTRSPVAGDLAAVPVWWRLSGFFVWVAMFLGGFAGVSELTAPVVKSFSEPLSSVVGGAVFGGIVALVVRLGAALALHGDTRFWKWAVLFQVVALGGDLFASSTTGNPYFSVAAVVPVIGLLCLAMAFRTRAETQPPGPPAAPVTKRR
jgi:hypothetical protein